MAGNGHFRMQRGWQRCTAFRDERLCERAAWAWLIEDAAFRPHKRSTHNGDIVVERGETARTCSYLAKAWGWHKSAVHRFLKRLQQHGMVKVESMRGASGLTRISVTKYEEYQAQTGDEQPANRDQALGTGDGTIKPAENCGMHEEDGTGYGTIEAPVEAGTGCGTGCGTGLGTGCGTIELPANCGLAAFTGTGFGTGSGTGLGTGCGTSKKEGGYKKEGDNKKEGVTRKTRAGARAESEPFKDKKGRPYAFAGHVIRLDQDDYERWRKASTDIPDVYAELVRMDTYYAENPPENNTWYWRAKNWLHKINQRYAEYNRKSQRSADGSPTWTDWEERAYAGCI